MRPPLLLLIQLMVMSAPEAPGVLPLFLPRSFFSGSVKALPLSSCRIIRDMEEHSCNPFFSDFLLRQIAVLCAGFKWMSPAWRDKADFTMEYVVYFLLQLGSKISSSFLYVWGKVEHALQWYLSRDGDPEAKKRWDSMWRTIFAVADLEAGCPSMMDRSFKVPVEPEKKREHKKDQRKTKLRKIYFEERRE